MLRKVLNGQYNQAFQAIRRHATIENYRSYYSDQWRWKTANLTSQMDVRSSTLQSKLNEADVQVEVLTKETEKLKSTISKCFYQAKLDRTIEQDNPVSQIDLIYDTQRTKNQFLNNQCQKWINTSASSNTHYKTDLNRITETSQQDRDDDRAIYQATSSELVERSLKKKFSSRTDQLKHGLTTEKIIITARSDSSRLHPNSLRLDRASLIQKIQYSVPITAKKELELKVNQIGQQSGSASNSTRRLIANLDNVFKGKPDRKNTASMLETVKNNNSQTSLKQSTMMSTNYGSSTPTSRSNKNLHSYWGSSPVSNNQLVSSKRPEGSLLQRWTRMQSEN